MKKNALTSSKTKSGRAGTARARLMESSRNFSKTEMKVVRVLLANYPAAGLTTVSKLARQAAVSDPTVLRLAVRLGYEGFADMQQALLTEVEAHMRSPLTVSPETKSTRATKRNPNVFQAFLAETLAQCEAATHETATADYERACLYLADPRMKVLCLGGRFSRFLAGILQRCLHHMRDGSVLLDGTGADLVDELATIGRRHVLVVFDYRRYQADIVRFAEQAKALGAVVILYTDVWKSPISNFADIVLVAPTATASPFDTLATPLLQVEAMAAGVAHRLGGNWRARAALLEGVRSKNHVTLNGSDRPARHHKERPKT